MVYWGRTCLALQGRVKLRLNVVLALELSFRRRRRAMLEQQPFSCPVVGT
jgi:hypothetical protein